MFRDHHCPPSDWCAICEKHVTNLATHMQNAHPVRLDTGSCGHSR